MKKGHRGRSPVRLTLPVTEWPAGDLQLWHAAQTPAGPFCPNSPAVTWSPARRHIVEDAYGQWLAPLPRRCWTTSSTSTAACPR